VSAYHGHLRLDSFRCNIHLQSVNLRILRITKVEDLCAGTVESHKHTVQMYGCRLFPSELTVKQLVNQDKIVLDGFLVDLAKV
jgi:hypothetical protein